MKPVKWTRETVIEAIKGCTSIKDFKRRYGGAFGAMKRNGWDDLKQLITGNAVTSQPQPHPQWTRERIAEILKTCSSGKDFRRRYCGAFDAMKRNGWDDLKQLLPSHQPGYVHPASIPKYTRTYLATLVQNCQSRFEFRYTYPQAYSKICQKGWCDLLNQLPSYPSREDETPVWVVYKWNFLETNAVYIGLTNNFDRRVSEELRNASTSPVKQYLAETGCTYSVDLLQTGLHSHEAADYERMYIEKYRADGYTVINRHPGGSLGGYLGGGRYASKSDAEILDEIFLKFHSYRDLMHNGKSLYRVVQARNLYEAVWTRLPKQPNVKYSIDHLLGIIGTCTTFSEFVSRYPLEYKYMAKRCMCHMLSGLDRTVPRVIPDGFDEAVALVNNGTLTRKEAASRLGISVNWFRCLGKGKLLPYSKIVSIRPKKPKYTKIDKTAKRAQKASEIIDIVRNKYSTLAELRNDTNLYAQVKRYGLSKTVSGFLERQNRAEISYSYAKAVASRYTRLTDFTRSEPSIYTACRKNGWTDILNELSRIYKKSSDIGLDDIRSALNECGSRTEFNKRFPSETYAAKKLGIYNDLVKDMPKRSGKK